MQYSIGLRVHDSMIALVRRRETGKFLLVRKPVELAGIDDRAADLRSVSVHIFRRRVRNDIDAPLEGPAIDRRRERIVDDKRNAVRVRNLSELLEIENVERGIGDRFAEHRFRVRAERRA